MSEEGTPQSVVKKEPANAGGSVVGAGGTAASTDETSNLGHVNREFQEKSILRKARDLGLPYIDIAKTPLNPDFLRLLDIETAKQALIVPFFKVGKKVRVAICDKDAPETQKALKQLEGAGYELSLSLASADGINDALKIYDSTQKYKKKEIVETVEQKSIKTYDKEITDLAELPAKIDSLTAEEGLNLMNIGAMKTGASDVHYEPSENKTMVRFRIDGVLHKVFDLTNEAYKKISEQLKYQSKMRINMYTVPQDGRYVFNFNDKKIAVRVSSIPTPYGESFVCRYLPSDMKFLTFDQLGFEGVALAKLQKASKIVQGMILVTGPTGSGKSTTLYSLLRVMNTPENKVITLEDPVEYYMEGVTQSQIDEKREYTFAGGLRSILRQDPDIVMLGEIRDLETAETAAQAALTGHVLLSTLHTNSAVETIPRLVNMGLPPFMVAPALNTVVAQRLVRKVCVKCAEKAPISASEKKEFEEVLKTLKSVNPGAEFAIPSELPKVKGCDACSNTGYSGRVVISEVVTISSEMKRLILNKASSVDLFAAARKEGILTMKEDGFLKVAHGLTTLEEVHRVTNVLA
ncbi:MAG: GspE/PulE family protein [Candidatus Peregrinibacteria bacterium]